MQTGLPVEQHYIAILQVPLYHIANLKMPIGVALQEPQVQPVAILVADNHQLQTWSWLLLQSGSTRHSCF